MDDDETCYCPGEYISGFWRTFKSSVPHNIIEFQYSFGYDVKRLFNLVLIDPDVLAFASGNLIHFFRMSTKEMTFRRSANGGGIGFLTKNPNPKYNYLTVAENGDNPRVVIYKYPEFEVISSLKGAARKSFTVVSYRPDGELLATQAGEPDYMLTIWKWQTSSIVLRARAFQNDVINVVFSHFNPTLLITCGLGHIKFWKMARTFTGLKLQGELGRFGKTEFSDIYSLYPLPDEKVISGCEWGNMLVWDAGLIKLEVCRKNRKPCHAGPITYINMDEGELMTVGMDGYIRIWFWESVEIADPPEEDKFVEIEPINEFRIAPNKIECCELRHLVTTENKTGYSNYAQDGFGGIWMCDLNVESTPAPPQQIFHCHGGRIAAIDTSPISSHFASICEYGKLHIYDYTNGKLLFEKKFPSAGSDLIWLPTTIDSSGSIIITGSHDGVIREILVDLNNENNTKNFYLIEATKPHASPITKLSINPKESILVSGSEDKTIFIYQLAKGHPFINIVPIGFVKLPAIPKCFSWKPNRLSTIAIGCFTGEVVEADLPERPRSYTNVSYSLDHIQIKVVTFRSVKSQIRRNIYLEKRQHEKLTKRNAKKEAMKKLKEANPGIDIDEEVYLADSEPEEELEPLYIPKIPNPVLWLCYTPDNTIWLSMAGYDAGYIYECTFSENDIPETLKSTLIDGADDIEIHSYLTIGRYLIFGMNDGSIRINAINSDDFRNLSDYWKLSMHDNNNGVISKICTSHDGLYLFTIGNDGNIFSYKWNGPAESKPQVEVKRPTIPPVVVPDIEDNKFLALEEQKIKDESDRRLKLSQKRKQKVLDILSDYTVQFKEIIKRNKAMPPSQQLTAKELELDERVTKNMAEHLDSKLQLVRRKLAFDVEKSTLGRKKVMEYFIDPLKDLSFKVYGIRKNISVKAFRIKNLDEAYFEAFKEIERVLLEIKEHENVERKDSIKEGSMELMEQVQRESIETVNRAVITEDPFLGDNVIALNPKMWRLLQRYRKRQIQKYNRIAEWAILDSKKPDINKNHPNDIKAILEAKRSIGDYKLKTDPDYVPPESDTTPLKYKALLLLREELFNIWNNYNLKVHYLRREKELLYEFVAKKSARLEIIHPQIPASQRKKIPPLLVGDISKEYPERNFAPHVEITQLTEVNDLLFGQSELSDDPAVPSQPDIEPLNFTERFNWQVISQGEVSEIRTFYEVCDEIEQLPKLNENNKHLLEQLISNSNETPWEIEGRYKWIFSKIIEQDEILTEVEDRINHFDSQIEDLIKERHQVEIDAKFLEERIMTMNQELFILRDCERLQQSIVDDVDKAMRAKNHLLNVIFSMIGNIEDAKKSIDKMLEQVKNIQSGFITLIKGNKYYDFLRRIFKKKFKPPKEPHPDDDSDESTESETSSSEEDADQQSVDSLELAPLRLDESVLPPGCDKKLYDMAFLLRSERHTLEESIHVQQKIMDERKKEIGDVNRRLEEADSIHLTKKQNLTDFMRERQKVLNKIKTLVVLKLDQLQYAKEGTDIRDTRNTLLFNSANVLTLYTRVGQLGLETLETKRQHRVNIVHLQRMTADCNHMNKNIRDMQEEVTSAMIKKFGMVVNMDEMEESVLRKFVYEKRAAIEEEQKEFDKLMNTKKTILAEIEEELVKETQKGTEKLNILTILQEEKNILTEVLCYQTKKYEKSDKMEHVDFRRDISKLNDICLRQEEQIEFLEKEIRTLRLRSKPLQPPSQLDSDNAGYLEILPPPNERLYEDTVYTALSEQKSPTRGINPEPVNADKISKIVQKFLVKTVGKQMSEDSIRKYTEKISTYLGFVAHNFDCDQAEKVIECIVENFQTMIPHKYLLFIKPHDIKELFNEIIEVFDVEKVQVKAKDVLIGIISNAIEVCSHIKTMNYTQEIVSEIFREMIEVFTMDDIKDSKNMDTIYKGLKCTRDINPKCISIDRLMENLVNHARENLLDEFDLRSVRAAAEYLYRRLNSSSSRTPQPEKPME